jgi:hypothetical protein
MKRYVLTIFSLLLCLGLSAQTTRTCRYWFDGNFGQSATKTFSGDIWDGEIDVSQLPDGIHTLHYYLSDSTSTPVYGTLFHKVSTVGASALEYRYWFDNNDNEMHHGSVGNGIFQIDVNGLTTGMHTIHLTVKDENYSATRDYLFIKTESLSDLAYHCWFDENESTEQTGAVGDGNILLDVTGLENGEHSVSIYLEGSTVSAPQTYDFLNNLAVDENESISLVVYPNPATDRLTIESEEVIHQCEIYDLTGQLVETLENDSERMEISVEALPAGIYLIRLVTDRFTPTRWFVKK